MIEFKKSTDWLFLSSLAIALAGLFSIIIVFARVPVIKEILPFADLFRTALVIHVDLSQIFWFLSASIAISLTCFQSLSIVNSTLKSLTLISLFLITISAFLGGTPILANYVPFIDENLAFSLSIGLFFSIIIIYNAYFLSLAKPRTMGISKLISQLNHLVILIAFVIMLLTIKTLYHEFPTGELYEYLFWGFGHVLQYSYCFILIFCWLKLANYQTSFPCTLKTIVFIHAVFAICAIAYFINPEINSYKIFFTHQMKLLAVAPTLLIILIYFDRSNISFKKASFDQYYFSTSVILFLAGGFIALFIRESNTIIPAHYHGSIVAITIAIMGFIMSQFHSQKLIKPNLKIVKLIPLCYFSGQLMHISGLALSGGYGALRKSPDSITNFKAQFWMGIMGMGGLIAIISGLLFIYVSYSAFQIYKNKKND
jgi:cytochrome c oxidase subunit 1